MKTGVVYFQGSRNKGDDLQTYAASLLVNDPIYCERERLDEVQEDVKLLCNGWFMQDATHWPPSKSVTPKFESFHISSHQKGNAELMTSESGIYYLKQHAPIGCRDHHTLNLLQKHNVESYFSGCLTLTLPKYEGEKSEEILFVDVLRTNYTPHYRKHIVDSLIPESYKSKVDFVTHFSDDLVNQSVGQRMKTSQELLERYGKAKLVFTSLIHCALPCIALGTPVVFVDFGFNNSKAKRDRFNGILDFFHIESNIERPLMKRDWASKIGRGLRFHTLLNNQMKPLPESLFEYNEVRTQHLPTAQAMIERVKANFQ